MRYQFNGRWHELSQDEQQAIEAMGRGPTVHEYANTPFVDVQWVKARWMLDVMHDREGAIDPWERPIEACEAFPPGKAYVKFRSTKLHMKGYMCRTKRNSETFTDVPDELFAQLVSLDSVAVEKVVCGHCRIMFNSLDRLHLKVDTEGEVISR